MRRFTLAVALTASATLAAQDPAPADGKGLVVHEWGTFTSMQGADGAGLEGLHHEEEALPGFVHEPRGLRHPEGDLKAVKAWTWRVTQKMETPVIYFHTDTPRRVDVTVQFKRGLMTQYYPVPDGVWPSLPEIEKLRSGGGHGPIDMGKLHESRLRWIVDLVPYGSTPPAEIPTVDADDPWAFARQVRAAYVRTTEPKGIERRIEAEHYLFYRGLGTFTLPVRVTAERGGRATLHNDNDLALPFVAALEMGEHGARFRVLGEVGADGAREVGLDTVERSDDRRWVARALGARVLRALVDQGLFVDEARAMVATWSRQWFESPGTRIIYVVPRRDVDRVLPLRIKPAPEKTVRVLVGRLEYLTPETEDACERALLGRVAADAATRQRAESWLRDLDRFLEPVVRRAAARSADPTVRGSARDVLARLAP